MSENLGPGSPAPGGPPYVAPGQGASGPAPGWGAPPPGAQPTPGQPYPGPQPQHHLAQPSPAQPYPGQPGPGAAPGAGPGGYRYALQLGSKPGTIPLRPMTLGDLLDGTFQTMRRYPGPILGSAALVATVMALSLALLTAVIASLLGPTVADPTSAGVPSPTELGAASVAGLSVALVTLVAQALLSGVLVVPTGKAATGERVAFGQVWREAFGRIGPLLAWPLLLGLVQLLLALVLWAAPIGLAIAATPALAALLFVTVPLWIACLVWLTVRFAFVPATIVLEKATLGAAMRRSRALSTGSFWRIFGILLLGGVIASVVSYLLALPAGMISAALTLLDPRNPATAFNATIPQLLVTALGRIVSYTLSLPFLGVLTTLIYVDVRIRREGLDVQLARAAAEARR